MNSFNILTTATQGVYSTVKWTITNTVQGCISAPQAIPVLATSLVMVNGGLIATKKCGESALHSFKNGEHLKGLSYVGSAVGAGVTSMIGGISTLYLISAPVSEWEKHDFNSIKDAAKASYDIGEVACQNMRKLPEWGYKFSKFVVEQAIQNPVPAASCAFSVGLSVIGSVVTTRCAKQAFKAYGEGNYGKGGTQLALAGLTGTATAITSFAAGLFLFELSTT